MVTSKTVDLTNCDREQIQYAGAIQPHGVLLVLQEPELLVVQASRNTAELLGVPADELVGGSLRNLFTEPQIDALLAVLRQETLAGAPMHVARARFSGREFDVLAHRNDGILILELEARSKNPGLSSSPGSSGPDLYSRLHVAISRLEATASLQSFLDLAAGQIRLLTGFDRVMIYQFLEDESGWVRAESLADGLEPYLGLHYPPSDIPAPARRLFSLTWVRHQPDIGYTPVPLFPENNPVTGGPLDMSYAHLRSVSIMYVDYLKNMGTTASMVLTLLKGGKLWGLVACHHHSGARHVPYETRVACEFVAHMVSLTMSAKEDMEHYEYRLKLKATQAAMLENIGRRSDFVSGFVRDSPSLLDFVRADGAATAVNGRITPVGRTPAQGEIERIVEWLPSVTSGHVFSTDCLSAYFPEAAGFKDLCAGLMALRFSETKDDFLLWFRPEILMAVNWAGDPHKPVDISGDGRLHPRTSFALWKETVRLKSSPWLAVETEAVEALRTALLELILRRAEELGRLYSDLERSHAELDSFAYVASHDLKEPLRGIGNYAEMLREDYAGRLDADGDAKLATLSRLTRRMDGLLDALLEYSQVGREEFSVSEVDLNMALSEALDLLQLRMRTDAVSIRVPRLLPEVRGDRVRVVEVFMNLISNAIKYNDRPEKEIEIGFEESASGGQPVLWVRDNGIGIAQKDHQLIFAIFRRLHARDEFGGGSGAGLTIVAKIVERAGGRIWLKSIPGEGTTFYFTLAKDAATAKKL